MGRMRGSPGGGDVNPLQRMLGTFLRLERARLGYSTKEVATRLGLTDTYLRLAESGRAALNQSLVFKLIEIFAASNAPTHDSRTISFDRFAIFLVGTHWVGAEMGSQQGNGLAGKRALETLGSLVGDFQKFYEGTKAYFDLREGEDQTRYLEEVAAPEVGAFLRMEDYARTDLPVRDILQVADVPTLNIDVVLDLKRSLADRPFVHTAEIAAEWESRKAPQFQLVCALFRTPDFILAQDNLDLFNYEYLNFRGFRELRFVFMKSPDDAAALTERFVKRLNIGRAKAKSSDLTVLSKSEIDKLKFVRLEPPESARYNTICEELLRHDDKAHDAYWSFETRFGLPISFIGLREKNLENVRNLNLRDADRKFEGFKALWEIVKP